jgi:hypothetical protein
VADGDPSDSFAKFMAENARPITTDEITRLENEKDLQSRVAGRLLQRYGWSEWPDVEMPELQRRWLAVDFLEAEALNGGVAQFVVNAGDSVEEILIWAAEGYDMLNNPERARVARRILQIVESERALRTEIGSRFSSATDQLLAYEPRTSLGTLDDELTGIGSPLGEFVRAHPAQFVG